MENGVQLSVYDWQMNSDSQTVQSRSNQWQEAMISKQDQLWALMETKLQNYTLRFMDWASLNEADIRLWEHVV